MPFGGKYGSGNMSRGGFLGIPGGRGQTNNRFYTNERDPKGVFAYLPRARRETITSWIGIACVPDLAIPQKRCRPLKHHEFSLGHLLRTAMPCRAIDRSRMERIFL